MALIQDSTDPRFLSQYAGGEMPVVPATSVATNIPVNEIKPTNPLAVPTVDKPVQDFNALMAGTSVSLPTPVSPEESAVKKNQSDILAKMSELGGVGAYQAELESSPEMQANRKELINLQASLAALNAESAATQVKLGNQPILSSIASGQQAQEEKLRAIKAMGISSQIQAMQGNIALAQEQIDRAIKLKYEPIKAQLDVLNKQLEFNYDTFTTAEKRRADQIKFENDIKMDEINKREDADKRFESLKIQALSNGMSATQAQQAQALYEAGQPEQAYASMSRYTGSKSADVNTPTSGSGKRFTTTQLNSGAAVAGLPIVEFELLDNDSKNYFISNKADFNAKKKLIDNSVVNNADPDQLRTDLESSDLPLKAKELLSAYIDEKFPAPTEGGRSLFGRGWDWVKSWF